MKKIFRGDYFYFSKSDRVAAFILLLIIVFVNILRVMIDRPYPVELVSGTDSLFITTDTVKEKRHYTEKQRNTYSVRKKEPSYSKSTRTNTIKKDTSFVKSVESEKDTATIGFHVYRKKQIPVSAVDLNSLDSAALTLLPGIGPYYAKRIVEFRNLLGGYADVQQLKEIDGIPDSVLQWFVVTDTIPIRKIDINRSSLIKLRNHPYISFYQAKAIVDYRRSEGNIKSPAQLTLIDEFTEQDLIRLEPYILFE